MRITSSGGGMSFEIPDNNPSMRIIDTCRGLAFEFTDNDNGQRDIVVLQAITIIERYGDCTHIYFGTNTAYSFITTLETHNLILDIFCQPKMYVRR